MARKSDKPKRTLPFEFPEALRSVSDAQLERLVERMTLEYYDALLHKLADLDADSLIKSANPFKLQLDKAAGLDVGENLIVSKLNESIETSLGNMFEQLAIGINRIAFGGSKAPAGGFDLTFFSITDEEDEENYYLVAVKSGTRWANSSSGDQLISRFKTAAASLKTSGGRGVRRNVYPVCGCAYGTSSRKKLKGYYYQIAGEDFWRFISGDDHMFLRIRKTIDDVGNRQEVRGKAAQVKAALEARVRTS
jgi:hypothetical protein